jgi:hypothetical protein
MVAIGESDYFSPPHPLPQNLEQGENQPSFDHTVLLKQLLKKSLILIFGG